MISAAEISGADSLFGDGFDTVDYIGVRDAEAQAKLEDPTAEMRVLAGAAIGRTRLIDNTTVYV